MKTISKNSLNGTVKGVGSVLIIVLIVILLIFKNRMSIICQSVIIWLMMFIISFWCTNCILSAISSSILLAVAISYISCKRGNFSENFETIDEGKNNELSKTNPVDEEKKEGVIKKEGEIKKNIDDTQDLMNSLDKMMVNKNMELKKTGFNTLDKLDLDDMIKYSATDEKVDKSGGAPIIKEGDKVTPNVAQKQLHQIIDSVKMLNDTVREIGPTLTQGKEIIKMFDKIKM